MSNIQTFLTIGAMIFLTMTSLRFNTVILENSTIEMENKVMLTAFSLADDMIEEIKVRSFDQATIKFPTASLGNLTTIEKLGPETGEAYPNFNDVDDFNGYTKYVTAPHAEDYYVTTKVQYVEELNPDKVSSSRTYYKKVTVTVTSPYMRNAINLSYIFSLK